MMLNSKRLTLASLLLLAACGGGSGASSQPASALRVVAGGAQAGVVGQVLANPILVRVVDAQDRPVQGQLVNFRVTSGGGSVFAGSSISNAQGLVQERWTLGTSTSIEQTLEARAVDNTSGAAIVFATVAATSLADAPASIVIVSGDGQRGLTGAGGPLPLPLVIHVTDRFGNPAEGVEVSWAPQAGDIANPSAARVDASGHASTEWTLSSAQGEHAMTAQVGALTAAFLANESCPTASPKIASGGVPACTGANSVQAGALVSVRLNICPRCDEVYDSCVATPPAGDAIIQLDPVVLVCSPSASCPINPSCAPVTCTFTAPAAGSYQLLVFDPASGAAIQQPFDVVPAGGGTSCGG